MNLNLSIAYKAYKRLLDEGHWDERALFNKLLESSLEDVTEEQKLDISFSISKKEFSNKQQSLVRGSFFLNQYINISLMKDGNYCLYDTDNLTTSEFCLENKKIVASFDSANITDLNAIELLSNLIIEDFKKIATLIQSGDIVIKEKEIDMSKSQPRYSAYFTQGNNEFIDWSFTKKADYSWIDELNENRDSNDDLMSKNFDNDAFPSYYNWDESFRKIYDLAISDGKDQVKSMVETAEEVVKIDELTIYLNCKDEHHYFSTRFYAHGDICRADIHEDSSFDSAETAVYAFVNNYNEWDKKYGKAYGTLIKLSELEALRQPQSFNNDADDCQHEDLGSLGYQHGAVVECPYCNKMAEVW